jgi:hypothetical protein
VTALWVVTGLIALGVAAQAIDSWRVRRRNRINADDQLVDDAARNYARDHDSSQIAQLRAMLQGDEQ